MTTAPRQPAPNAAPKAGKDIASFVHEEATRRYIPTAELEPVMDAEPRTLRHRRRTLQAGAVNRRPVNQRPPQVRSQKAPRAARATNTVGDFRKA